MPQERLTDAQVGEIKQYYRQQVDAWLRSRLQPLQPIGSTEEYVRALGDLNTDPQWNRTRSLIVQQWNAEKAGLKASLDASRLATIQWIKNKWYRQAAAGVAGGAAAAGIVATKGAVMNAMASPLFGMGTFEAMASTALFPGLPLALNAIFQQLHASEHDRALKAIEEYFMTQMRNAAIQRHRTLLRQASGVPGRR